MNQQLSIFTKLINGIRHPKSFAVLFTLVIIVSIVVVTRANRSQIDLAYVIGNGDRHDKLAYISQDDQLILYDPVERIENALLDNVSGFVLSRDGRVAFTKLDDNDLYVFDTTQPDNDPINISQTHDVFEYPLAWSPNGRYLAFGSFTESSGYPPNIWIYQGSYTSDSEGLSLYVWDGETNINAMPDQPLDRVDNARVDWSHNGQLAFTLEHSWSEDDVPAEIYLWDGHNTTNISQNPNGYDGGAQWSNDGKLLFGSHRGNEEGVFVWDGTSFANGVPDASTFIQIAPELQPSRVTWTEDSLVAFVVYTDTTIPAKTLIQWDTESQAVVKEMPVSSQNAWSWLAEGGQVILSSHLASGIPSVYLDVENTVGEIVFSEHVGEFAWSASGYLAFCGIEERYSRLLSIWNGEESWIVARTSYRPVQWQNGDKVFSCNNG